ncbi:short-chain dehydrogenase reductase sdr [Malassezia pachydermatis]|uniref:Short-chain dehydrogenase reductase sdr n=1 Tax=Malassezia pachydermatis TaxID=77020 RepID=A0A0M8MNW5_9BASI|nr:short-chain dehydrogenase reductase sdr [Malassezia pachydermatis]KOS13887.1 short-chain dehydrogenase reductase sdr [Malassezia pachydermatis]
MDEVNTKFDQIIRTKWEQDGERVPLTSSPLARAFACDVQDIESIKIAFRDIQATWPDKLIGTCLYNASIRKRGPFLDIPVSKLKDSVEANIIAPYVFAQESLRAMNKHRQGGTIIFTGATSSVRGAAGFAPFAASKGGLRNMCQSLAREYGEQNVHIAHVIVDGLIESKTALSYFGLPTTERFQDGLALVPDEMAKSWLFLAQQHPSTWTFEMDLRPAKEHF